MRASQMFLPTLREAPAEAELVSHRLLLRAGFIKKLSAGVYSYLPLGLRSLNKVAQIVREEANRAGCIEILMPVLVPIELLQETGRDTVAVLYKTRDRTERDFALGFTHEEVVTDIVRSFVQSYRDMPLCLYQIQAKFRDEPRPRGGLIRGKEFLMFDAYSFDVSEEACSESYQRLWQAYERMFRRMGLNPLVCEAESGDIGGSENHEFMVITEGGEDRVLRDDKTGYTANAERCPIGGEYPEPDISRVPSAEIVDTPGARTVAEVTSFLKVSAKQLVKTLLVSAGDQVVGALVRGDRELNPYKLARVLGVEKVTLLPPERVREVTGADVGFAGPIGLPRIPLIADQEIRALSDFVVGANQDDRHYVHVCHTRDFPVEKFADIRLAEDGDPSPFGGILREVRGIEVGHIFQLGTKYSSAMNALFTDAQGHQKPIVMGCYGLGIGRSLQAIVEVSHDEAGIIWPLSVAPYEVVIIPANQEEEAQARSAEALYHQLLERNVEVLLDDRDERAGAKFKDADLIGYPLRVVCGKGVVKGQIEVKWRWESQGREIPLSDAGEVIARLVEEERAKYL